MQPLLLTGQAQLMGRLTKTTKTIRMRLTILYTSSSTTLCRYSPLSSLSSLTVSLAPRLEEGLRLDSTCSREILPYLKSYLNKIYRQQDSPCYHSQEEEAIQFNKESFSSNSSSRNLCSLKSKEETVKDLWREGLSSSIINRPSKVMHQVILSKSTLRAQLVQRMTITFKKEDLNKTLSQVIHPLKIPTTLLQWERICSLCKWDKSHRLATDQEHL